MWKKVHLVWRFARLSASFFFLAVFWLHAVMASLPSNPIGVTAKPVIDYVSQFMTQAWNFFQPVPIDNQHLVVHLTPKSGTPSRIDVTQMLWDRSQMRLGLPCQDEYVLTAVTHHLAGMHAYLSTLEAPKKGNLSDSINDLSRSLDRLGARDVEALRRVCLMELGKQGWNGDMSFEIVDVPIPRFKSRGSQPDWKAARIAYRSKPVSF